MPWHRLAGTSRWNKHRDDRARGRFQNPLAQNDVRAGRPSRGWEARWNKWKGQDGSETASAIAAVRLLMLTGCRLSEIQKLLWEHVDLGAGELRLPDTKTGAKVLYLGDPAITVLERIDRRDGNPWVIAGRKPGSHLTDLQHPWRRIRARAGLNDVRIHDLRHSYALYSFR